MTSGLTADAGHLPLPKGLAVFRRILRHVGQAELALAIAALVVVTTLSGAQALLRYSVGGSIWWAQEVAETTIMVAYFLGISYVFKTRQYILIEFVSLRFPPSVQMACYVFAQVLTVLFTGATVYLVVRFAPSLMGMRTPLLSMSGLIPALPLAVGSALMVVTSLYYLAFGLWVMSRGFEITSVAAIERRAIVTDPMDEVDW
ncbi:TRAP transporter small permease [Microbaculum marinum]|uniref:TRAP transporter small permease protein n=1 Tax=Microbaculum marinum TaxID=1764581 RepID=A0AAW9RL94_9HYPH